MKKAIIIGASSGIGRELAKLLDAHHYEVGIAARRLELLTELQTELHNTAYLQQVDITHPAQAQQALQSLLDRMQEVDLIILTAGTGQLNPNLSWELDAEIIQTNVLGVSAIAIKAMHYFMQQGRGVNSRQ